MVEILIETLILFLNSYLNKYLFNFNNNEKFYVIYRIFINNYKKKYLVGFILLNFLFFVVIYIIIIK